MSKDETKKNNTPLTDVSGSMVRHPKWEKVEADYEFQPGEPYRHENGYTAVEGRRNHSFISDNYNYFRDTTWQAPVKPSKVGDLIETVEQAESLPIGTIAVSMVNEPIRKVGMNEWRLVNAERSQLVLDYMMADEGDRIIYLPSGGSDD